MATVRPLSFWLWILLVLTAPAGCGAGDQPPPPSPLTVSEVLTGFSASEIPTSFTIRGTGFAPVGGTAQVRFLADEGEPFLGGEKGVLVVDAKIVASDEIRGTTPVAGVRDSVDASVEVVLSLTGEVALSNQGAWAFLAPVVTTCVPSDFPAHVRPATFRLEGDNFGADGAAVTVRFEASTGTPFLGGTASSVDVVGEVQSVGGTACHVLRSSPFAGVGVPVQANVRLICPSGATAPPTYMSGPQVTFLPEVRLTASTPTTDDKFGTAVAIHADTVVVGASAASPTTNQPPPGCVYVYVRTGTSWTEEAHLVQPGDVPWTGFGASVAIIDDTLLVGAPHFDVAGNDVVYSGAGAVWVYQRSGGTWTLVQGLAASDPVNSGGFGASISVWPFRILVGAPHTGETGAAYTFTHDGSQWVQEQKLTSSDGTWHEEFGHSVDFASDTTLVVGAPEHDATGAVYVYDWNGLSWTREQKITPEPACSCGFGFAVAASRDMLAASGDMSPLTMCLGAVCVYERSGTSWSYLQQLQPPGGSKQDFGRCLAMGGDLLLVGDSKVGSATPLTGAVHVYEGSATSRPTFWSHVVTLTTSDPTARGYGSAVGFDFDSTAVVGAPWSTPTSGAEGAVYVH